jgi:serine/threonine-protein kinase
METDLQEHLQDVLGDAYDVERELGGGSMSRVFVVVERSLGRRVVVKVLPPEQVSGVSATRFQREILVTANLQHPHVLPVLSAGARGGLLYYVTPYVEGQSLRERLVFEGRLSVEDAVSILRDVADALAYAHERGIVHRDVKPENILLSRGHAILADFGIAHAAEQATTTPRITGAGPGVGTLGYQAPEQLANDPTVDARADVYALGAVGYELLAGQSPFTGATRREFATALLTEQAPPLTQHRADVPPVVVAAIARALEKDPEKRFATGAEFRDALPAAARGRTPEAIRRRRRRRRVAGALVLAAVAGAGALGLALGRRDVAPGRQSLAVLPFKNLGPAEDAYFADGITEELTSRLASVAGLSVISRTSADQYRGSKKSLRQIARELGADYVLEGSVRWERTADGEGPGRGRVRVTPQLIRVRDDSHLWADRYDAELSDVFELQSRIASRVVGSLAVTLGGAERRRMDARPTENLAAYGDYIRGELLRVRDGAGGDPTALTRATELLTAATVADPRFALAFAKLSLAHAMMYLAFVEHTPERLARAQAAADSALALDPSLPEGHLAQGMLLEERGDVPRATAEYALAEAGRPNDSGILAHTARVLASRGRLPEGLKRLRRAAEIDPRSLEVNLSAADGSMFGRDYRAALDYANRARAIDTTAIEPDLFAARLAMIADGDRPRARTLVRGALARFGADRVVVAGGFDRVLLAALDTADLVVLERVSPRAFGGNRVLYLYWRVLLLDRWRPDGARAHADSLVREAAGLVRATPNDWQLHSALGWLNAVLGRRDEAIAHSRHALTLMPRSLDAIRWTDAAMTAAMTYTRVGDRDAAVALVQELLDAPAGFSLALLRTDPVWAPLRDDPRIQRRLALGS